MDKRIQRIKASIERSTKKGKCEGSKTGLLDVSKYPVKFVKIDQLSSLEKESNFDVESSIIVKLAKSIERYGLLKPITVWEKSKDNFVIISGDKVIKAYNYLNEKSIENRYNKVLCYILAKDAITENNLANVINDIKNY